MKNKTFVAALLAGTILSGSAWAGTIEVSAGDSIQSAVDRARAGDTVLVAPGTYAPFQITKDGITVRSAVPGGAHVVARGKGQPAIAAYGQNNIGIQDFRITSQGGDGVKVGGNASRDASNIVFTGNTVETAAMDGLKFFQAKGLKLTGNTIRQAGTARNGNGDGGIDFVGVDDSIVQENKVERTYGAACLMMKGGSDGNTVTGNALLGCEQDGVTVGGFTANKFMDRSDRGLEAHNNTITGNQIQAGSGKCGFYYHEASGNRVSGNQVSGGRSDCPDAGGGAKLNLTNAGSGTRSPSPFSGGLGSLGDNVSDTGDEFWGAVERGEAGALHRLNDLVSGGVLVRQGNALVNRVTGQVTSVVGRQIDAAVDAAFAPIENTATSMADAFICGTFGGWAKALVGINICAAKQLSVAGRQLNQLEAMNAGIGITNDGMLGQMDRAIPAMQQGGFLSSERAIGSEIEEAYPNVFETMTPDELIALDAGMKQRGRQSQILSFQTQNRMVQEQVRGIGRVAEYAAAGRAGDGVRAELQASNAIQGEMVASVNMLTNSMVANHRAASEIQLRNETKKEAANKAAEDFMSSLTRCDDCTMSKSLFRN